MDNSHRQLHGALLDAQILGDVYLALTSGQEEIGFAVEASASVVDTSQFRIDPNVARPRVQISAQEQAAHDARLEKLRKKAGKVVWDQFTVAEAVAEPELATA